MQKGKGMMTGYTRAANLAFDSQDRLTEIRVWVWGMEECDVLLRRYMALQGKESEFQKTMPGPFNAAGYTITYEPHCSLQENFGAHVTITATRRVLRPTSLSFSR